VEEVLVKDKYFIKYIDSQSIENRVDELVHQITDNLSGKNPILLAVLNGSFFFAADICKRISFPYEISFVKISSYKGMESVGEVKTLLGLDESLTNRHILIIEDIIDSGLTMSQLLEQLKAIHPASVSVATFVVKMEAIKHPVQMDYIGFEVENKFLVGYGLDYDKQGRHLKHIYKLKED
jgi:hypoxanthine phosphoribosyltransferase